MRLYFRLLRYTRKYWARLALSILFSVGISVLTSVTAWLVGPVLSFIFLGKQAEGLPGFLSKLPLSLGSRERMLLTLPMILIAIYLLRGFLRYGNAYMMSYVGSKAVFDVRNDLYGHLVVMPLPFYSEHSAGKLISRVVNDVGVMQGAISSVVKDLLMNCITIAGLTTVMFYRDWKLALMALVVLPIGYVPLIRLAKRMRKVSRKGQEEVAEMTTHLEETFTGIRVVKSFGMESIESRRFSEKSYKFFRAVMKGVQISETSSPIMEFLGAVGLALIIWYGGYQVIHQGHDAGSFFSFIAAVGLLYAPIKALNGVGTRLQSALAAAERVFEVLDLRTEKDVDRGTREVSSIRESVEIRGVSFQYPTAKSEALRDVTFEIRAGEVIALVGRSGSGKSTLANLLLRFYDPTAGEIRIDGVDIRGLRLASLRAMIGLVSQDVILFDDTVRNDIAYGKSSASPEEIEAAARAAYADEFIRQLPRQYETMVGEKGVRLSGGQKQRIAIARTLLRNPPILILDEATSALDSESEFMVQQAITHLMKGRTTLVIAHRFSTVKNADRIVVLDQGRVMETGKHDDLLNRDGAYRKFYDMQLLKR